MLVPNLSFRSPENTARHSPSKFNLFVPVFFQPMATREHYRTRDRLRQIAVSWAMGATSTIKGILVGQGVAERR
jgi:hypothetical protein